MSGKTCNLGIISINLVPTCLYKRGFFLMADTLWHDKKVTILKLKYFFVDLVIALNVFASTG